MYVNRRAVRTSTLFLVLVLAVSVGPWVMGAGAQEATPRPAEPVCTSGPLTLRTGQEASLCTPIVFADGFTGDLWLTDEFGAGPYRLTSTPMIEDNPSSMGFWVAFDGGSARGGPRDIYMMSILGGSRLQLTGHRADDFDPSLGYPLEFFPGFGMPVTFSSDRVEGKQGGKCDVELYLEVFGVSGPQRVTQCDRRYKMDAELAADNTTVAYTAMSRNGRVDVWVADGKAQSRVTDGPDTNWSPTWAPSNGNALPSTSAPAQRAAAGSDVITYAALTQGDAGSLNNVHKDGTGDVVFLPPPDDMTSLLDAEWDTSGQRIVFARQKGTKSRVGWAWADGTPGAWSVTTKDFYVTALDWINFYLVR